MTKPKFKEGDTAWTFIFNPNSEIQEILYVIIIKCERYKFEGKYYHTYLTIRDGNIKTENEKYGNGFTRCEVKSGGVKEIFLEHMLYKKLKDLKMLFVENNMEFKPEPWRRDPNDLPPPTPKSEQQKIE